MRYVLILLATTVVFAACQTNKPVEENPVNEVSISGVITNHSGGEFHLYGANEFELSSEVNDSGMFYMTFEIPKPGSYTIKYGGEYAGIYLSPGDELSLILDTEMFDETLTFTGQGSDHNNYLMGLYLLNEEMDIKNPWKQRYARSAENFRALMDSMLTVRLEYLASKKTSSSLSESFTEVQEKQFVYQRAIDLYDYESRYKYFNGEEASDIPEDYYNFNDELELVDVQMIDNDVYNRYVDVVISRMASELMDSIPPEERDGVEFSAHKIDCIDEVLTDQELKNKFLEQAMMITLGQYGAQDLTLVLEKFEACCTDDKCLEKIASEIEGWKKLWTGNPAPVFKYADVEGTEIGLEDLRGQVVYVDVWATWCGPCRREIPHLEELETAMHDENVAFVSVSIDEDAEAWKEMVTTDEMGGIQIHAPEAWDSDICANYKINGIPRFILIDQSGNIVSADAPRPSSDEEIKSLIRETLESDVVASVE